jgi:type I restriction enzyme S subunit
MFIPNEKYLYNNYLFHFLSTQSENLYYLAGGGAQPNLSTKAINNLAIPIPPLAEQKRIADLLDKFEALTTSLSDGIPAEQAAQQKRYEYYRDLLLTFPRKEA